MGETLLLPTNTKFLTNPKPHNIFNESDNIRLIVKKILLKIKKIVPRFAIGIFFLYTVTMLLWMKNWIRDGIPLSPREENIQELAYMWNLYHLAEQGDLFNAWNSSMAAGSPNLIQRSNIIFAPLVYLTHLFQVTPDHLYKVLVGLSFVLSACGTATYLMITTRNLYAAIIGGLIYMLSPPHIAIGLETLDFNIYWAIFPWLLYSVELFIQNR